MLNIALIVLLLVIIIFSVAVISTKRKTQSSDERLEDSYIYRKEPHADQVAEQPNRLDDDNEITKG